MHEFLAWKIRSILQVVLLNIYKLSSQHSEKRFLKFLHADALYQPFQASKGMMTHFLVWLLCSVKKKSLTGKESRESSHLDS